MLATTKVSWTLPASGTVRSPAGERPYEPHIPHGGVVLRPVVRAVASPMRARFRCSAMRSITGRRMTYRIRVLHRGQLTADGAANVQRLQDQVRTQFSNAVVEVTDVAEGADPRCWRHCTNNPDRRSTRCVSSRRRRRRRACIATSGPDRSRRRRLTLCSVPRPATDSCNSSWTARPSSGCTSIRASRRSMTPISVCWKPNWQRLQGVIELPEIDPVDLKELSTSPDDVKLQFTALPVVARQRRRSGAGRACCCRASLICGTRHSFMSRWRSRFSAAVACSTRWSGRGSQPN